MHQVLIVRLELKNPTHGSIKIGINGVVAAQHSHYIVLDGNEVETDGNQYAHLVLREVMTVLIIHWLILVKLLSNVKK